VNFSRGLGSASQEWRMPRYRTRAGAVAARMPRLCRGGRNLVGPETAAKEKARPKPGSMASPITPSWNSVVGFLTDWDGLRKLAA
jgi:hypothetical protein